MLSFARTQNSSFFGIQCIIFLNSGLRSWIDHFSRNNDMTAPEQVRLGKAEIEERNEDTTMKKKNLIIKKTLTLKKGDVVSRKKLKKKTPKKQKRKKVESSLSQPTYLLDSQIETTFFFSLLIVQFGRVIGLGKTQRIPCTFSRQFFSFDLQLSLMFIKQKKIQECRYNNRTRKDRI